jgi:serine/threonine-protein kinase
LLLALAWAGGSWASDAWPRTSNRRIGPGQVPVPDVRGLSEAAARDELQKAGLRGRVHQKPGPCPGPATAGLVVSQQPEPDQEVPAKSWVEISVCPPQATGRRVEVPLLLGLEEAQAQAALKAAGLRMQVTKRLKCSQPEKMNRVVGQDPPAGQQARPGQRVGLRICRGR